jgi:hypothetical protein
MSAFQTPQLPTGTGEGKGDLGVVADSEEDNDDEDGNGAAVTAVTHINSSLTACVCSGLPLRS